MSAVKNFHNVDFRRDSRDWTGQVGGKFDGEKYDVNRECQMLRHAPIVEASEKSDTLQGACPETLLFLVRKHWAFSEFAKELRDIEVI